MENGAKKLIVDLFNHIFDTSKNSAENKKRRLAIDESTGEINWSNGEKPFKDGPEDSKVVPFRFEESKENKTRLFRPVPASVEPYRENRFSIKFPGIPEFYFNSYSFVGNCKPSIKNIFKRSKATEVSSFRVIMLFPSEIDLCDKMQELHVGMKLGDIDIELLDPTGMPVKTIKFKNPEIVDVKFFDYLNYGSIGDKSDNLIFGEIIVKHEKRKIV